jgi:hypothetical protein
MGPPEHPIQYVPWVLPPVEERQGREADHSLPFSLEVKSGGAISPLSFTPSWDYFNSAFILLEQKSVVVWRSHTYTNTYDKSNCI